MAFVFEHVKESEADKVLSLYRSLVGTPFCAWTADYPARSDVEFDLFRNALFCLRDEETGEIAGVISIDQDPKVESLTCWTPELQPGRELSRLGVRETYQNQGIARKLMDTYHSVIYFSASDLFEVFSRNKFDYDQAEEMKDTYRYILDCDLLIIDDLGTELNNSFTSSQLFYCINERMNMNRSTIISTNLSLTQLRDSYTDRVTSRIMRYRIIPLYGRDIRLLKR